MSIQPAGSGSLAVQRGLGLLNGAASRIARDSLPTADAKSDSPSMEKPLVELKQASLQVQAGAKVLKAEHGMVGTLLDEFA